VAELIAQLDVEAVRANLEQVGERIARAAARVGRDPRAVEIVAATKYVPVGEIGKLADAGVRLAGENRAQDLLEKVERWGERLEWDFIGTLQSRKVRQVVPHVRLIHSLASESALRELGRWRERARPGLGVLIEVNIAREPGKGGVAPEELPRFLERAPLPVRGLMTMPPLAGRPEQSRPSFVALRELAARHGLAELSMGTSQDFEVAVEEGATIVRIGTTLYEPRPPASVGLTRS